jgi:hypothetical protein
MGTGRKTEMTWLIGGSEIVMGIALLVGLVMVIAFLRPPRATMQERLILRAPGAWIVVGLSLTIGFAASIALIVVGVIALY